MSDSSMPFWLSHLVPNPLSTDQAAALTRWALDVKFGGAQGPESCVEDSALIRHLAQGNLQVAKAEFAKWCLVDGHVNSGKLTSRLREQRLFGQ